MRIISTPNADSDSPLDVMQPGGNLSIDLTTDEVAFPPEDHPEGGVFMFYIPAGQTLLYAVIADAEPRVYFPLVGLGYPPMAFDKSGEILIKGEAAFTLLICKNKEAV